MVNPTNKPNAEADRLAELQAAGAIPMTAEEVLAGQSQGGVPRPAFLTDAEDDGSVHRVQPGERP